MKKESWDAIAKAKAVQLEKRDQDVLNAVQTRLACTDQEFLDFLSVIGKLSGPGVSARLRSVHL
jgi:hypothetical protein